MSVKGHKITNILPDSIAEELEIQPGDVLLKINDTIVEDVFDYHYLLNEEYVEILIQKPDGQEWLLEIEKDYEEDLGIEFENGLMDEYRSCRNKCMFCFIDQMPPGMRETLYFKDDDSRLSFLQGNYITLTNLSEQDIKRMIKYHLEPVNISVHTTNPDLRCKMLNNRFAGTALQIIDRLYEAGITMNGQIVLCKGVNDKEELEKSICDLSNYIPVMESVSVVPAGLTKYRENLYPLELFEKKEAEQVIDLIESYQKKLYKKYQTHFVHASDEWYILAGRDFPEEDRYDGYLQLENGVGMMRLFRNEFEESYQKIEGDVRVREVSVATAVLAYDTIQEFAERIMQKFPNIKIHVYVIYNHFFGESITVSGLLTGMDLREQLKNRQLGECLYLPNNILRSGEDVFLDDMTRKELENSLQVPINIVKSSGQDLIWSLIGENQTEREKNGNFVYIKAYPEVDDE